jgi:hypothetical protein
MAGFLVLVVLIGVPVGSVFAFWLAYMMIREVITGDPEMWGKRMYDRLGVDRF